MIKRLLKEEIQDELKELKKVGLGTEEYKIAVDGVAKLIDKSLEMDKFDADVLNKHKDQEIEVELKEQQLASENRNERVRHILTGASIVIPVVVTVWGTMKTFEFEKEGTVTTMIGRNFINRILPKK